MKITESLCPVCYSKIPAVVHIEKNVMITKQCPIHGMFESIVERDPQWFKSAQGQGIYDGYLIDVTSKCNIKCKYCYHDNNGSERSVDDIIQEAGANKHLAPFILTGGEPTTHKDLPEIIRRLSKLGEVNLLTNGIKLCDETYLNELLDAGLRTPHGVDEISLSFHMESNGKDIEFLEYCKRTGRKIWTCFYVIDNLCQIHKAIELFQLYKDQVCNFRIKAASNLWNEGNADNKIFTSDMIKYLFALGNTKFQEVEQKVSYAQVWHQGLDIKLISWYDIQNIDLWDINCAPYYKSQDGNLYNFATAAIVNEGIERQNGIHVRRAFPCDIPVCGDLWRQMTLEENPNANPNQEMWCAKMYDFIKHDNNHLYIGEMNGKIVAFVSGFWDLDPLTGEKFIVGTHFYVQPEFRNSAIGKKLHNKYLNVGRNLGVSRVVRQVTMEHSQYLISKGQKATAVIVEERI